MSSRAGIEMQVRMIVSSLIWDPPESETGYEKRKAREKKAARELMELLTEGKRPIHTLDDQIRWMNEVYGESRISNAIIASLERLRSIEGNK